MPTKNDELKKFMDSFQKSQITAANPPKYSNNVQGNFFTHSEHPNSLVERLVSQIKEEVTAQLTPKILNFLARNLSCDCTHHSGDCPWSGDLKTIRARLEDAMCSMQLVDKLTL